MEGLLRWMDYVEQVTGENSVVCRSLFYRIYGLNTK